MTNIQSHRTSNVCSITQYAAIEAWSVPQDNDNEMIIEIKNAIGLIYYQEKEFDEALPYFYSGMQKPL